jgi:hypothetical protein
MTAPNTPISPRIEPGKSTPEKEKSERPSGKVDPDKFRRVYEIDDQKVPHGAILDDEEIDAKKAREKRFGEKKKTPSTPSRESSSKSIFDLAKETPHPKTEIAPSLLVESSVSEKATPPETVAPNRPNVEERFSKIEKIQEIIDKITDEILHIENEKKGESTLIILKDEGTFKGASIKISDFDSSKKEFNITIDNLSPPAKELVQRSAESLMERLATLGYTVQNFTATSAKVNERIMISENEGPGSKRDERGNSSKKDEKKR